MRKIIAVLLALAAAPASGHDCCEHQHFNWQWQGYLGAAVLHNTIELRNEFNDGSLTTTSADETDVNYRLFAGLGFARYFGLEFGHAEYGDVSKVSQSNGSGPFWASGAVRQVQSVSGIDLSAVVRLPLLRDGQLVGQVGGIQYETSGAVSGPTQSYGDIVWSFGNKDEGILYGLRLEYDRWAPLRFAVGYTQFEFRNLFQGDLKADSLSAQLAYVF